jgi:hypothetical protein
VFFLVIVLFVVFSCTNPFYPSPSSTGGAGGGGSGGGGNGGGEPPAIIVSYENLAKYLETLPTGSAENPTTVKLDLNGTPFSTKNPTPAGAIGWGDINKIVDEADKYVILDLSGCTVEGDTIGGARITGNSMAVIRDNSSIKGIDLPSGLKTIGASAFSNCIYLTRITIPSSVTTIGGGAFISCAGLTSVNIPAGVTSIEYSTFSYCTGLTNITIPDSVTSIENEAFAGCTSLASVTIIGSVTDIGWRSFEDCSRLTSLTISAENIEDIAFARCTGLTNIIISAGVKKIAGGVFHGCTDLVSVTFETGSAILPGDFGATVFPEGATGFGGETLRDAYLAPAPIGGAGTYIRSPGGSDWTKQ